MRSLSIALLFPLLLAACATAPSGNGNTAVQRPVPVAVSNTFRACYSESKLPWLVSVVAQGKSDTKTLETLVAGFVGGSSASQSRALSYLNDLGQKKHDSGEHMASAHFNACMGQGKAESFAPIRATSCYQEQRLIFALQMLRFDAKIDMAAAAEHLIAANRSADGSTEAIIRRLARDTYTILKPGGESAFSEAQFNVCMTKP